MTKEKLKKQRFVESNSSYEVYISVGWAVLSEQEHECEDEISQICGRKCDMTSDRPGLPGTESQWNEEEVEMERKGGKFRRKRS